jgi:hypothetical protein
MAMSYAKQTNNNGYNYELNIIIIIINPLIKAATNERDV